MVLLFLKLKPIIKRTNTAQSLFLSLVLLMLVAYALLGFFLSFLLVIPDSSRSRMTFIYIDFITLVGFSVGRSKTLLHYPFPFETNHMTEF